MSRLFKGSRWHWIALLAAVVLLGYIGERGLHVRQFLIFLLVVVGVSFALVVLLVSSQRPLDDPP